MGLGLAALGRPGYMTLGRDADLPTRTIEALQARSFEVLDAAYAAGIRVFDVARSYGRAEVFLQSWLASREIEPGQVVVSSKWGYTYKADWQVNADVHEVKEHSLQRLLHQWEISRQHLWEYLDVYQIHSATLESGVLDDESVMLALAGLKATYGIRIGLSLSGPGQADTLRKAMEKTVDGQRLFDTVQATWNALEPSVGPTLLEAREAGLGVIVKESLANGRLTSRGQGTMREETFAALTHAAEAHGTTVDAWAMAAVLAQPWADVVLSGAVSVAQLQSNLQAAQIVWRPEDDAVLAALAEGPVAYWGQRKALAWS